MKNEKQLTQSNAEIVAINATVDEARAVRDGLAHKVNIVAKVVAKHPVANAFRFPQGPILINGQWHL